MSDDAKQITRDFRRLIVPLKPERPLRSWHVWGEFDPYVEALAITEGGGGKVRVRVHQIVKNTLRDVLSESEVFHVYSFSSRLIS